MAEILRELFLKCGETPRFALLAPDEDASSCRYTLYIEGAPQAEWIGILDHALRRNPHYAYCRDLGQLWPPRIFAIAREGFENFMHRQARSGAKLGDIKPASLSRLSGWSEVFDGAYLEHSPRSLAAKAN